MNQRLNLTNVWVQFGDAADVISAPRIVYTYEALKRAHDYTPITLLFVLLIGIGFGVIIGTRAARCRVKPSDEPRAIAAPPLPATVTPPLAIAASPPIPASTIALTSALPQFDVIAKTRPRPTIFTSAIDTKHEPLVPITRPAEPARVTAVSSLAARKPKKPSKNKSSTVSIDQFNAMYALYNPKPAWPTLDRVDAQDLSQIEGSR